MTKPFSSVWTRQARPPKRSGLTRDQIVAATVELLDADGLDALSMRKLGARLNAGATSLYWYVANKDELLELALDEVWGLVETPDPDHANWREVFTTFAYSLRATIRSHPWAASLLGQLPSVGPNAFALTDRLRRTCLRAGFAGTDVYLATALVMSFILGQVIPELTYRKAVGGEVDHQSVLASMDQLAADYPQLRADYRDALPQDPEVARALAFDFGLVCVLDGMAARLGEPPTADPGRPGTPRPRTPPQEEPDASPHPATQRRTR
ncbi:TetR/AcrR family transcriptional regulator [Nocardia kruczakiae]|uniref:TetR/AcrR family transcriptional regulator n=1 Tax=Nocardia kruczakiae TaxID=261477 RepID=UPI000A043BFF|nr:TetR/AcrR family transcriptional regulator [Nocardia kruczakiae]